MHCKCAEVAVKPIRCRDQPRLRQNARYAPSPPAQKGGSKFLSAIASYVDSRHCDMVVMGTRGLSPVGGLVLGSVTSRVIHLVKVPVTLVKWRRAGGA
jgi:nucleotide-binding universal stress UspA family protein